MSTEPESFSSETGGVPPPDDRQLQPAGPPLAPWEIWNLRDLLLFLVFTPFALVASKLLALIGYVVLRPFAGWHPKVEVVQSATVFLLVEQCIFYILILGFLLLLARAKHHQPFWKSLGWHRSTRGQLAGYLAGGAGLAVAVTLALSVRPDSQKFPLEQLFNSRSAAYAIGAFAISLAPVVEELVFRGLLFAVFERAAGMSFAVVTTGVLFAALHVPEYWHAWHHIILILAVGMVFSFARGATGSLTPSIFLHIGYNFLIVSGLFVSTQHFRAPSSLWTL